MEKEEKVFDLTHNTLDRLSLLKISSDSSYNEHIYRKIIKDEIV